MKGNYWTADDSVCELCGKPWNDYAPDAEMYDPNSDDSSLLVHYGCGRAAGLIVERMKPNE